MDQSEEYHDPDYPEIPVVVKEEAPELSNEDKVDKIRSIIHREFSNELEERENEVMQIEQRMSTSRRILHRLRYALVNSYYYDQKLQLSNNQIEEDVTSLEPRVRNQASSMLRDGQRRLHPSVRKLLGKQTADLSEVFLTRSLRNKTRKDYSAMIQTRNYTIAADSTKSLRPDTKLEPETDSADDPEPSSSRPKKVPRHLEPKTEKVVTIDDPTRNKMKHRYRFIIGNTSKYAPGASRADRSTHKWLLYVRGPPPRPDPAPVLTSLVVRLHNSYAPHHTVTLSKAPFHISRRGWGEFPARLELHFPLPDVNRPATLDHTIKLDRNYTGLQTLGAETIVDVWLYSTPEMLEYEYFDPIPTPLTQPDEQTNPPETHIEELKPKVEPIEYDNSGQTENWLDFFSKDTTELDVDEMIIKPEKKEMDVDQIIIKPVKKELDVDQIIIKPVKKELDVSKLIIQPVKKEIVEERNDVEQLIDANVIDKDEEKAGTNDIDWSLNEFNDIQPPDEISQTTPKKRIMKYIDSATGKIYYLEMDRNLDLSKVQEIVINNSKTAKISPIKSNGLKSFRKNKGGVSLLKPEVKNQLKSDIVKEKVVKNFSHIENDHCYLGNNWKFTPVDSGVLPDLRHSVASEKKTTLFNNLCSTICRFTCVRDSVYYLLKNLPIITELAKDVDFVSNFPFVVENQEKYWKLDFAKRRNIEWSRAKLINKMLTDHFIHHEQIWSTKQILIFSRLHGFNPIRPDPVQKVPEINEWPSWDLDRKPESNIKKVYSNEKDICSLTVFDSEEFLNTSHVTIESLDSDEDVDIVRSDFPVRVKKEIVLETSESELTVLPVESEEDRLRFLFIEKKCADIGIELRNEDVGNGYSYSAVHAVLLSAMKSLAEELVRSALAATLMRDIPEGTIPQTWIGGSRATEAGAGGVYAACGGGGVGGGGAGGGGASGGGGGARLSALALHALAAPHNHQHYPI